VSAEPLGPEVVYPLAGTYHLAKRTLDVLVASIALIVLIPVMVGVAIAIAAGSGGAPLFRQRRVGRFGREFRMWKFRTMVSDAEQRRSELVAHSRESDWLHLDHDPRITRIGRVLRRTSLDELPQLLNVLWGDMSLVGPRPLPPVEHSSLPEWSSARLEVRPGLTGLWQVMGRTQLEFPDMLRLDCEYVHELSWRTDLKILILTVPAVVTGRGAN
jgi:exopolysaccharide production protein ExoY